MTDRIIEFISNLLKMGKEQFLLKSGLLRSKVPIEPVLGLTGLGILFLAFRPLLTNMSSVERDDDSAIAQNDKAEIDEEYDLRRTLYLMREKEKQLSKQEASRQNS